MHCSVLHGACMFLNCVAQLMWVMWFVLHVYEPPSLNPPLMVNRLFPCVRRISQDLAKDLAILAREIHDVAGEIDSVSSSGTAPSTTVSTAATTPGSAIDTREEVQNTALKNHTTPSNSSFNSAHLRLWGFELILTSCFTLDYIYSRTGYHWLHKISSSL